jgi:multiple sugar transport system ATP-binding protein
LFDEPLSNLDAPLRAQMRRQIAQLQRQLGVTAIYVTHDQAEAMALGAQVAVMNEGVIQQLATPRQLYHQPANLFVARFIGSPPTNLFWGDLVQAGGRLCFRNGQRQGKPETISLPIDGGMVPRLVGHVGKPVVLGLRPEDIHLRVGDEPSATAVHAVVRFVETLGAASHVHLSAGSDSFEACWREESFPLSDKEPVVVSFDMTQALFFDPVTGDAII